MNTIKFTPINDIRKETSNVEVFSIKELVINDRKYKYFSDAQLSIYVTKRCNAACPFCMNKFENRCLRSKELNDKEYYDSLDYYLNFFKDINPFITITGGEPTISKRLIPTLKKIKDRGFKIRTFSTNGSHLLDKVDNKPLIQYMLENNVLNNINISRMVIDDNENSKIMKINVKESNNNNLRKIASFANINNIEIRISCNLLKEGVNDLKTILEFKDFYNNLGIKTVMFRELIPLSYDKDYHVNIVNIFKEIDDNNLFKLLKVMEGMYYTVKVYKFNDYLVKCYKEKEIVDDSIIREFVIYPDGKLDNGYDNETLMEVK